MTDHSSTTSGPVKIAVFDTSWEAHLAQGLLADNGIRSMLENEIFSSLYPIGFNSLGGIPLFVNAEDASKARELLDKTGDD